jgi:tRNA (cytidine/uridine-2'-O-)-methyltransferase
MLNRSEARHEIARGSIANLSLADKSRSAVFHVVLYQPEIPPNTGNIIRLCANTGARLHLIRPLGFELDDRRLRRAGLDYHEWAEVAEYDALAAFVDHIAPSHLYAFSTRGQRCYAEATFEPQDALLFGPETRGLPETMLQGLAPAQRLRLPMRANNRSLNLSNTVAVVLYEAWRQNGFAGGA